VAVSSRPDADSVNGCDARRLPRYPGDTEHIVPRGILPVLGSGASADLAN
jgi:hypothetical protein